MSPVLGEIVINEPAVAVKKCLLATTSGTGMTTTDHRHVIHRKKSKNHPLEPLHSLILGHLEA